MWLCFETDEREVRLEDVDGAQWGVASDGQCHLNNTDYFVYRRQGFLSGVIRLLVFDDWLMVQKVIEAEKFAI